ncbi:hypothetical protein Tco_1317873 [Tanacetum coccineum]
MANLSEDIQCTGSDTRPPMLDRTDFASWQQRIRLYCRGKENGVNILKSIDEGPFQMGMFRETLAEGTEGALGPERPRVYSDLSHEDKDRYNADIRATNFLLQGLPKDIYSLINHDTDAKDIWDNVKMLLEGSKLTKEDRKSQLMQLNFKFVNNMLPEWGRFVTAVKLNRGLRDSNYDQLYAFLKQHEAHANENKMMLDRFTQHTVDPLALMTNVAPRQYNLQSSTNPSSTYVPPNFADNSQLDSGLSPTDNLIENLTNTLALLTKSYKTYLPQTNNQLRTSSNPRNQATVQDSMVVVQNVQGQARQVKCYNCNGGQDNVVDEDVDEKHVQDLTLNVDNVFQADDCDAFDSDVDEAPTAQTMFMANLSSADPVYDEVGPSYDSDTLSEEQVELYERRVRFELTKREQKIDEQLRIVISDRNIKEDNLKKEFHSVKLQLASTINHNKSMVEEVTYLKKDFKQKENKYLKEFLDMKALKEKVDDRLYKQDQSLQTVHMLCKPKPYYNELNKVIPFFKTLKEHFEGIQKALTKEVKEMKEIFEELEAEVDQHVVDRKHDEIERKNILIANDNLIADCLFKDVFHVATNSELNVSRFTKMHDAHTARCLELEVELSNLRDKIQKDNHDELIKQFSNLEVNHLNLQLKYQNLKKSFRNDTSPPTRDVPDFDSVFVIEKMKALIQGKDNANKKLRM